MTTMITEVYDALVSAGADDAKARRAAKVMSGHEGRFDRLEHRLDATETRLNHRIDAVEAKIDVVKTDLAGRINLLQWQLALLIGGVTAIVLRLFLR